MCPPYRRHDPRRQQPGSPHSQAHPPGKRHPAPSRCNAAENNARCPVGIHQSRYQEAVSRRHRGADIAWANAGQRDPQPSRLGRAPHDPRINRRPGGAISRGRRRCRERGYGCDGCDPARRIPSPPAGCFTIVAIAGSTMFSTPSRLVAKIAHTFSGPSCVRPIVPAFASTRSSTPCAAYPRRHGLLLAHVRDRRRHRRAARAARSCDRLEPLHVSARQMQAPGRAGISTRVEPTPDEAPVISAVRTSICAGYSASWSAGRTAAAA